MRQPDRNAQSKKGNRMQPPGDTSKAVTESNMASTDVKASITPAPVDGSTAASDVHGQQHLTGVPLYAILVGLCVGSFLMSTDVFIISTVSVFRFL